MKIVSHAKTPEQMKSEIVKYLRIQTSQYRTKARLCIRKIPQKEYSNKADAAEFLANSIDEIEIIQE